jgi:serine/threonine-protein kinase/endoribonuclease IRE1
MPSDKEVLLQMATGLQYIHSQNLIHRDVKPGNILISGDRPSVLKWSDFGLSKYIINKKDEENNTEDWSFPQGTEGWMAPEMIRIGEKFNDEDNSNVGQECDIFSLGCVFYFFLFSASHPFGNKSHERKMNVMAGNPINFKSK